MPARKPLVAALAAIALVLGLGLLLRATASRDDAPSLVGKRASESDVADVPSDLEPARNSDPARAAAIAPAQPAVARASGVPVAPAADEAVLLARVLSLETREPLVRVSIEVVVEPRRPFPTRRVDHGFEGRGRVHTDDQGLVAFTVPADARFTLIVTGQHDRAKDRVLDAGPLAAGTRSEIEIALETARSLSFFGRIVSASDGAPIADALVEVDDDAYVVEDGERNATRPARLEARTDARGGFELRLLTARSTCARVTKAGFAQAIVPLSALHRRADDELLVPLHAAATVRARIVDDRGRPRPEHVLALSVEEGRLLRYDETRPREAVSLPPTIGGEDEDATFHPALLAGRVATWRATTDADGRCELRDLPVDATLAVEVLAGGRPLPRPPHTIRVGPGETRELDVVLVEASSISGRVVAHDGPLAGQEVWIVRVREPGPRLLAGSDRPPTTAVSDALGRFRFDGVHAGRWTVSTAPPIPGATTPILCRPVVIDVEPGVAPAEVELRAVVGGDIRGVVLDPAGEPAQGVPVYASAREPASFVVAHSQDDGSFVVGPLLPREHELSADGATDEHAPSETVTARAGARDVVLRLRPGAAIDGRAIDAASGSELDARVELYREEGDRAVTCRVVRERSRFRSVGLAPGRYTLVASRPEGSCGVATIDVGTGERRDVDVALRPGAVLRVACAKERGFATYEVRSSASGAFLAAGQAASAVTRTHVVPPGTVVVRARADAEHGASEQEVEVEAGASVEVVLR